MHTNNPTMPGAGAKSHGDGAEEICKLALEQKRKMLHFCTTVKKLEDELIEEEVIIEAMHMARDSGKAGDQLSKGLAARRTTVVELNKELLALVDAQTAITEQAAMSAGKMMGQLEANSVQMQQDKAASQQALAFLKTDHDNAFKAKDDAHREATRKLDMQHAAAKKGLNAKMDAAANAHVANMASLSKDHTEKSSRMVTVNAKFLAEVQKFVNTIKGLLSQRAQYDGVFTTIENAMAHINQELAEFTQHATEAPQVYPIPHPPPGSTKKTMKAAQNMVHSMGP